MLHASWVIRQETLVARGAAASISFLRRCFRVRHLPGEFGLGGALLVVAASNDRSQDRFSPNIKHLVRRKREPQTGQREGTLYRAIRGSRITRTLDEVSRT